MLKGLVVLLLIVAIGIGVYFWLQFRRLPLSLHSAVFIAPFFGVACRARGFIFEVVEVFTAWPLV
jgi:hypothetical protein